MAGEKVTTNATPAAFFSVRLTDNTSGTFLARIQARAASGEVAGYLFSFTAKASGGSTSLVGSSMVAAHEDVAAWDVTAAASGGAVVVSVTGSAGKTVTWTMPRFESVGAPASASLLGVTYA